MTRYYDMTVVLLLAAILALQLFTLFRKQENYDKVAPLAGIKNMMKTQTENRMEHKIDLDKLIGNQAAAAYDEKQFKKQYGFNY